ncbi:hypothetical protein GIB67_037275 [Kingdonia uniflora]|uniref:Chlororespiratory reduction 21 n=1 Tax=Kingdonia uniflora TaxID=39325 RepID=A0A7J7MSC7_9MAGN|nr:hypothetical protein GIB67_037275 [Kingdonia uniflora]
MLCSPKLLSTARQLILQSSFPSAAFLQTPFNDQQNPKHPSLKTQIFIPSGRLGALLQTFKTTHADESHLSIVFCSNALKLSAKMGFLPEGKQLHSQIIKMGYNDVSSLQNHLLNLYVKCGFFVYAFRLLNDMPHRSVVSWNIMISGFVCRGRRRCLNSDMGLFCFKRMLGDMVEPDSITFIGLVGVCIDLDEVEIGKQVHCFIMKSKHGKGHFADSAIVDMYGKFGLIEDARRVFNRTLSRDLVLWNVMLSCYALNGLGGEAFGVFELMRLEGVKGDGFTFSSLLSSLGTLGSCELVKQIHGFIIRLSFDLDVLVASTLVDVYVKNGSIEDGRKAFDGIITKNVVCWNSMIVGYGQYGDGKEATKLFHQMLRGRLNPDELTLASILSSCANLAAITEIVQIHAHATKKGLEAFLSMGNALINAYAKCGSIPCAFKSFSLVKVPNLVTWTSMIAAYAFHGLSRQAIDTFKEMLDKRVRPDRIAFVGVLSACSHGGLVDEGFHYFNSMRKDHQIEPDSEHYASLVDLLGRAGHLDKAYNILASIPVEPDVNVLGAFFGACKTHKNVHLAKWAAEKLFKLEPDDPVNYKLMSNVYASVGYWTDVSRVRKMMRDQCDYYKVPGCSWTEIGGKVQMFVSDDKSHPRATEVYDMLGLLIKQIRKSFTSLI